MKIKYLILLLICFCCKAHVFAQKNNGYAIIKDGILIRDSSIIDSFPDEKDIAIEYGKGVKNGFTMFIHKRYITDIKQIKKIDLKTNKPILLVTTEKYDIQYQIDSILFRRINFYDTLKYSYLDGLWSDIEFPVAINDKLLSPQERKNMLKKMKLYQINDIKYLNREDALKKYQHTPFGVVELILK